MIQNVVATIGHFAAAAIPSAKFGYLDRADVPIAGVGLQCPGTHVSSG